jgi:hypothetical protein
MEWNPSSREAKMSGETIRKLLNKVAASISERLSSKRIKFSAPIKITIYPEISTGSLRPIKFSSLSISGETYDLSKSGIAFIVSSIRLKEYYLVGEGRRLHAEIDLTNGKIKMELIGVRYEQIDIHDSASKYLVGARIVNMSREDREAYEEFYSLVSKVKSTNRQSITLQAKG